MTREQPLTDEGQVVGTLQYMAPEQLEGRAVDARTDLFAFGALVHEMATGRKAFEATSQTSLVAAILGAEPPAISALQPLSPPALDRVVKKCLAKDPDERWQTARDLADALKWISQDSVTGRIEPFGAAAPVLTDGTCSSLDDWSGYRLARRRGRGGPLDLAPASRRAPSDQPSSDLDVFGRALGGQLFSGRQLHRVSQRSRRHPAGLGQEPCRRRSDSGHVWRCSGKASRLVTAQRSHRVQPLSRRPLVGGTTGRPGPAHPGVWRCAEILGRRQAPRLHSRHMRSGSPTPMAATPTKFLACRKPPGAWIDRRICHQTDRRSPSFTRTSTHLG